METTVIQTHKNLSELGVTLDSLYDFSNYGSDKKLKQINIHLSDNPYTFHVILEDVKGYDCKISSFGANLWARTKKGLNYQRYKTFGDLQRELVKLIKNKVDTNGEITFSLSDEYFRI